MRITTFLLCVFAGLLYVTLRGPQSAAVNDADIVVEFGEPGNNLSATDRFLFEQGRALFKRRFTRLEGLGPHFNATSCASCHEDPVEGGSGPRYRDFFIAARNNPDGTQSKLYEDCTIDNAPQQKTDLCLPSVVVPNYGPRGTIADPVDPEVEHPPIPPEADVVARRNSPPLFGTGYFRFVSDEEILSRADPDDANQDGISGRVNRLAVEDDAIGRFGFKCQTASVEAFTRGALMNQMGITSDSTELVFADGFSIHDIIGIKKAHAQAAEPKDRNFDFDGVSDPEIFRGQLRNLILFTENLGAPPRQRITAAVTRGEGVFADIGCASCHTPSLDTSIGVIHPYSDLLLHDMGEENADGVVMGDATGSEFRTQPLWGFCFHPPFLHDGSADTIEGAIAAHGGEGQAAREAYNNLSVDDKSDLHRFLESL